MTYQEALNFNQNWTAEQAKNDLERYLLRGEKPACKAVALGMQALEKQIPKKPINKTKCDNSTAKRYKNCNIVVCPLCNGRLKLKSKGKHCDKCGQALDWSDAE